jgi:hypothetical protein
MRIATVILAILLVIPVVAASQTGVIGLYADQNAGSCELVDAGQGILNIYVIHTLVVASSAAEFAVEPSAGFTATHIGDQTPYLFIGNSQTGISVAYGECLSAPINIMTITYLFDGTSSACGYLEVVAHKYGPPAGLFTVDCQDEEAPIKLIPQGARLFVNADGSCPCLSPVPVRESTWGQIKAMYN